MINYVKKESGKRRAIFLSLAFIFLVCSIGLSGCGDDSADSTGDAAGSKSSKGLLTNSSKDVSYEGGQYGDWGVQQDTDTSTLRDYYTNIKGDGTDTTTIMVYMIGSNLESEAGAASADLQEMIDSDNGDNVNVVVQTGGSTQWYMDGISADTRQRWLIQNGAMTQVGDAGEGSMCSGDALGDFVTWSAQTYPASRYMLVLWDHGGGTMYGYGSDENYADDGPISLSDMAGAIADTEVKLDIMSFDACLMGTLEVAYAFEPTADYLIASEETEPGDGWYYTDVLAALSENPSMPTIEFGARLIDDFGQYYDNAEVTLSLIDLREIPKLYQDYVQYYNDAAQTIASGNQDFNQISTVRSKSREYGDGDYEQIDLIDFIQKTNLEGADSLVADALSAVKYKNNSSLKGSYGLAIYFPYSDLDSYQTIMQELAQVQFTGVEDFYNTFVNILAGGQQQEASNSYAQSGVEQLVGTTSESSETSDYQSQAWYDNALVESYDYGDNIEDLTVNYDDNEEAYALTLAQDDWDDITDIQLQVMLDDGEGYIDLGSDQIFSWIDDESVKVDFDNQWIAINGQTVAYYANKPYEDEENDIFSGYIPAMLNEENDIYIYIQWKQTEDDSIPTILGYRYQDEENNTSQKGYFTLKEGDIIDFTCDYYTYDGDFDETYLFGDQITITSQDDLKVTTEDVGDYDAVFWLCLTDIYQQNLYTETLVYE